MHEPSVEERDREDVRYPYGSVRKCDKCKAPIVRVWSPAGPRTIDAQSNPLGTVVPVEDVRKYAHVPEVDIVAPDQRADEPHWRLHVCERPLDAPTNTRRRRGRAPVDASKCCLCETPFHAGERRFEFTWGWSLMRGASGGTHGLKAQGRDGRVACEACVLEYGKRPPASSLLDELDT